MTVEVHPSLAEIRAAWRRRETVPLWTEVLADTLTPVAAYAKVGAGDGSYLLESVTGGETWGRYSFVGFDPWLVVRVGEHGLEVRGRGKRRALVPGDPWNVLRRLLARHRAGVVPDGLPRFWGGAVGYVSYGAVRHFEPKALRLPRAPGAPPDAELAIGGTVLAFDARRQTMRVIVPVVPDAERTAAEAYDEARRRIAKALALLASPSRLSRMTPPVKGPGAWRPPPSSFTRPAFVAAVQRAQDHIRAGDVIQVVLSRRFRVPRDGVRPLDVYRALRALNPSPYMFMLRLGERVLVGASPETMVRLEHGTVTLRPIAGTRPRGATPEADAQVAEELLADPKELAEHVMLVDLGRNDVGRISEIGSVRVTEQMVVERYSHVMHIVSSVSGRLAPGRDALDVLAATFPAGTLSGAPKVRAMQIIEELEPEPRGIYGGAVGYIGFDGNMDLAIAIRTVVVDGSTLEVQAGAGIVEASDPEAEHKETLDKARAPLEAIAHARRAVPRR